MESSIPDVRAEQVWQLADGRKVMVQTVDGNQVTGAQPPMPFPGDRGASPVGSVVVYVGTRADFVGGVLLSPRWQVVADVLDDGLPEAISGLLIGVATIEHRTSFAIDPERPEQSPTPPRYTFSLAATDDGAAAAAIRDALGDRLVTLRDTTPL